MKRIFSSLIAAAGLLAVSPASGMMPDIGPDSSALYAQTENSGKNIPPSGLLPMFYYDVYNYRSNEPGKTRVDVYVEVPFEGIQFLKSGDKFTAKYSVTLSVYTDKKEKLLTEKTFNETVNAKEFSSTTSRHNHFLSVRSFELPPANYVFRCEVEDRDSRKNFVKEDRVTVRDMNTGQAISDIILAARQVEVDGNKKILPNISRNVSAQKEGLSVYYELYSNNDLSAQVEYVINDSKNTSIYKKSVPVEVRTGANQVNYTLENPQISMGEYDLIVSLKDNSGGVLAQTAKKFYSKWVGLPNSANDLNKAIDQMVYIAKDDELDNIKDTKNQDEKLDKYVKFWKAKDPSPSTEENEVFEEYYRRIAYANDHFKHYLEGWKTDMGMIYVTLGPPSNVERHPFEYDSKPYEVWDYYDINKRFVFVDQTGFGDYRLISPVYGNWWKYRQ